ncbi:hypothetical protein EUX98_g5736 [Antrodiella citrinella]|uniref:ubiquitinyl hydrolase 1 n=1 Tax=Antrodiella citrinella TaxID=2447956 RepID=A0A4S4MQP8_9APHY|nr:hypothetical protein EUX98_g5736 [Antrodiella citrinella]
MLKHKKAPTPQDLYKARKQREEEEKDACLPPGLVNHGNTCFMNSTLQGLIATQSLHDLVVSGHVNASLHDTAGSSITSRRSPLLTNGHGVGGQHEQARCEGMPLGDVWLDTMQRAWDVQDARKRESMSPKDVLTTIGSKYDQYQDFQQQDAHEFLRHLLDAMRMEEVDIIKKRQPQPKSKRRKHGSQRSDTLASSGLHLSASPAESEKLESFVDMLFGGRLASILVCEKCKKISVTYEDFNDLSLSIKPEDYVKERKRDRFKMIAKKLRFRPKELDVGAVPLQRASSVPASPVRRSMDLTPHEDVPVNEGPRRESFDHPRPEAGSSEDELRNAVIAISPPDGTHGLPPAFDEDGDEDDEKEKEVKPIAESHKTGKVEVKESVHFDASLNAHKEALKEERDNKEKDKGNLKEDSWNKLGRRVSVAMKMGGKNAGKRLSRSMDRHRSRDAETSKDDDASKDSSRPSSRRGIVDSGSELGDFSDVNRSRAVSPIRSSLVSPPLTITPQPLLETRRLASDPVVDKRAKSPRPPKASREEAAYLRQILADIPPSAPNPFTLLHQALSNAGTGALGTSTPTTQPFLTKLGFLSGIEECLRLFTSVEVLDGDNMVGCHRCWKIANGTYEPRQSSNILHDEENGSNEDESPKAKDFPDPAPDSSVNSSPELSHLSSASTPVLSNKTPPSSLFLANTASTFPAPTTMEPMPSKSSTSIILPQHQSFGGLPIPSISTTAPESPIAPPSNSIPTVPLSRPDSSMGDCPPGTLLPPRVKRLRKAESSKKTGDSSESSDDGFESSASDASGPAYSDASSAASSLANSPTVSPRASIAKLRPDRPDMSRVQSNESTSTSNIPRSHQVVLRRMYKRYLVATPPPILVVHLKRFQQTSKMPVMSFSAGFKKMDEFVAFPEHLDLAPFLAPKQEDFGLGKSSHDKSRRKPARSKDCNCMYRLYAVVVHIGNMLGGHYVAYTALPSPRATHSAPTSPDPNHATPVASDAQSEDDIAHHGHSHHERKSHPPRQWAYISDTVVRLTTLEEVLKAKAYICMYERI